MATNRYPYLEGRSRKLTLAAVMAIFSPVLRVELPDRLAAVPDPAIFAINHNASLESVAVPSALIHHRAGRPIHFMIDWMFLHLPLVGWIMRQVEPIPVFTKPARWRIGETYRRRQLRRSPVAEALAMLATGRSVGVFPEGTRNRDPRRLLRARAGLGRLILGSQAPVVPIGIEYPARHRSGRVPRLGRMVVRVGEPLDFGPQRTRLQLRRMGGSLPRAETRLLRDLSDETTDRVMRAIAALCRKEYPFPAPPSHMPPTSGPGGSSS